MKKVTAKKILLPLPGTSVTFVLARVALRDKAKQITLDVEGITEAGEEDKEFLETI